MVDYSLNETTKLALLAAKGAGYSWGMAQEASRSVSWLVRQDLPGPKLLKKLLLNQSTPESIASSIPNISGNHLSANNDTWLCPLASGCAVSDSYLALNMDEPIVLTTMKVPVLMLPFVAQIALRSGKVLVLEFEGTCITTNGEQIRFSSYEDIAIGNAATVVCRAGSEVNSQFNPADRVAQHDRATVDQQDWDALTAYAQKTYAPATQKSRALGAGSGLNDND